MLLQVLQGPVLVDRAYLLQLASMSTDAAADTSAMVGGVRQFMAAMSAGADANMDQHWAVAHAKPSVRTLLSCRLCCGASDQSAQARLQYMCCTSRCPYCATQVFTGLQADISAVAAPRRGRSPAAHSPAPTRAASAVAAAHTSRPQDFFETQPDNANTPFVPELTHLERAVSGAAASPSSQSCTPAKAATSPATDQQDKLQRHAAQMQPKASSQSAAQCAQTLRVYMQTLPLRMRFMLFTHVALGSNLVTQDHVQKCCWCCSLRPASGSGPQLCCYQHACTLRLGMSRYAHPLAADLEALPGRYQAWQLGALELQQPAAIQNGSAIWVDTPEGLQAVAKALGDVHEFAVDLEHSDRCAHTCMLPALCRPF